MYVKLNLETIQFYLIKLVTDFYWQPSYLLGEIAPLLATTDTSSYIIKVINGQAKCISRVTEANKPKRPKGPVL
jgi:hypothetical protein